jgi:hypothetical protein
MSGTCRASVLRDYDLSIEATRHADLYEWILSQVVPRADARLKLVPPYPGHETSELPGEGEVADPRTGGQVQVAPGFESD